MVSPAFLFGDPSDTELGGIFPLFWNSLYILGLTMLISIPVGILAGIYMSEYAGDNRLTNSIRFAEEAISSVPSIVVGLFGLIAFVNLTGWGYTALSGALALTLFNLPLLARLTEQALRAVPPDERAGSLALGATKWQTVRHVVLPLAIPGIITGIILTAGRVFGEAAVLLFTAGQSTPTHYDFTNFDLSDPELAVESVPAGDDARGVHLEEQRRGPRQLRDRGRQRVLGGPAGDRPRLQPLRPGVRALPEPAPDRHMNEDESMTAAPTITPATTPISVHIDTAMTAPAAGGRCRACRR